MQSVAEGLIWPHSCYRFWIP